MRDKKTFCAPFWAWNGELDKDELLKQVSYIKEMGFDGFFMHSRTGLSTEYLGEKWFDCIKICAKEAAKNGLDAYIYDEDRWPSGSAGGMAVENPRFRMKQMSVSLIKPDVAENLKSLPNFIALFAVKLNGNALVDYYPVSGTTQIKSGYLAAAFTFAEMEKSDFYNGYTYLDTLNREATDGFLRITHARYASECGDMLGKEIKGVFVDEPHRGCVFGGFGKGDSRNIAPYTYELFSAFEKSFGYDLKEKLPELFFERADSAFSKVSYDYIEILTRLFIENFAKPYYEWCFSHGIKSTGHVMHEDSLSNQTASQGSVMRYYEYMDYPGVDILGENNRNFWTVKQATSVSRQLDKPLTLTELYGCTGWQLNFQSHKNIGDWQAFLGVNFRCHHLSWYTMQGAAKRDYPASIFYQSAWYDRYSYVEEYFARLGEFFAEGESVADTLVISPVESAWGYVHLNCFDEVSDSAKKIKIIDEKYFEQFYALIDEHIEFDYADEELLSRYGRVENKKLYCGKAAYGTVLLSGAVTVRSSTVKLLKEFVKAGGKLIVKDVPEYTDGVKTDCDVLGFITVATASDAAKKCKELSPIKVYVSENGFLTAVKRDDEGLRVGVLNLSCEKEFVGVEISVNVSADVIEADMRNGGVKPVTYVKKNGMTVVSAKFAPGQEHCYKLGNVQSSAKELPKTVCENLPATLPYELNEPNILVLDMPEYYINGQKFGRAEILRIDKAVREKFGLPQRGEYMKQPWYKRKFENGAENEKVCSLKLEYIFEVSFVPDSLALLCETPEKFEIFLNGRRINTVSEGTFIDNVFEKIKLPPEILKQGKNILSVQCDFSDGINLESCYLIGNFGVDIDNKNICRIVKLPEKLDERPLREQRLPFYSGKIKMFTGIEQGEVKLKFERMRCAYTEVDFGSEKEITAFAPYDTDFTKIDGELTFTCCMTRRNTFGPLHVANPIQSSYGPDVFVRDEDFTENYTLYDERIVFPEIEKIFEK